MTFCMRVSLYDGKSIVKNTRTVEIAIKHITSDFV